MIWSFGGSNLTVGEKYTVEENGANFGALTISNVTFEDRGVYTCTYANVHGVSSTTAELTVQGLPHYHV